MSKTLALEPIDKVPHYAVIIRAIHERGPVQTEALAELNRRGLWLSDEQKVQAGLLTPALPPAQLWVAFSDCGNHIRQWSNKPFEGATSYGAPQTPRPDDQELYKLLMLAHGWITQHTILDGPAPAGRVARSQLARGAERASVLKRLQAAWEGLTPS